MKSKSPLLNDGIRIDVSISYNGEGSGSGTGSGTGSGSAGGSVRTGGSDSIVSWSIKLSGLFPICFLIASKTSSPTTIPSSIALYTSSGTSFTLITALVLLGSVLSSINSTSTLSVVESPVYV